MAESYTRPSSLSSDDDKMKDFYSSLMKIDYFEDSIDRIFVVRESKYFQKEWVNLKRPICFKKLEKAQDYVESRIDEVRIKIKFNKNEETKVERLSSTMTWYYTIFTSSSLPIARLEIFSTKLF